MSHSLSGKTIVFTGTLQIKRADAKTMAVEKGATVTTAISGKTNILVCGPDAVSTKKGN